MRSHIHCVLPIVTLLTLAALAPTAVRGGDWPMWRGTPDRIGAVDAAGLPTSFEELKRDAPLRPLRNVKWAAPLGQSCYGSPIIAGGKVYLGGCESGEGTPAAVGVLWCFDEATGALLWKFRSPYIDKLYNRTFGICAPPVVEGNRVYLVGMLGEVLCLDANGLADGNDGPFTDEASLLATGRAVTKNEVDAAGRRILEYSPGVPGQPQATDADIIWRYDMLTGVNCFPYNALNTAVTIRGDKLYVATTTVSSGLTRTAWDWQRKQNPPVYPSPNIIVLDKATGALLARDETGAFDQSYHGAHASPALGTVNGKELLFWGGGGVCYGIDPEFAAADGTPGVLKTVWQFRCTDPASYDAASVEKRATQKVEIVATPVFYKNRVYVAIGNDPKVIGRIAPQGRLVCIDATRTGDITATGKVWSFEDIRSSCATVAIADGLVYTGDTAGFIYCLDAETGQLYWKHDAKGPIWASPLVAGGQVFVPIYGKGLLVLAAGKELRVVAMPTSGQRLAASPAVANGVLYMASQDHLYALQGQQ